MKSLYFAHYLSTGALVLSLLFGMGIASAQSTPPARTYQVDQYGRETKEVKERWGENSNGQKHGVYLHYAKGGTPIEKYTYVNGLKNGPAYVIAEDWFYSISFRPTMKFVGVYANDKKQGTWTVTNVGYQGALRDLDRKEVYVVGVLQKVNTYRAGKVTGSYSYSNGDRNGPARVYGNSEAEYASGTFQKGKPSGTWLNAANSSEEIRYKKGYKLTFANGKAISATNAMGKSVALVSESEVAKQLADAKTQQATAKRQSKLDPDFFVKDNQFKQSFLQEHFTGVKGEEMSGDDVIKSGILKSPDVSDLIRFNPSRVASIMKMSFLETGVSPIKMIMTTGQTAMDRMAKALIDIESPQVSGELLYWALRGVADEKRAFVEYATKDIISRLGNNSAEYKALVEKRFYDIALAEKQYDPKLYPLRRWLYEQYKNDEPYKWMNTLTQNSPRDNQDYPERTN